MGEKSLIELCLQVITKNIDRFSYAFNTTTDAVLKKNFDYLQFCYSDELHQIMSEVENVREECFPLLINKYMTELKLWFLDHVDERTLAQIFAEIGEGLAKISFGIGRPHFRQNPGFSDIFPHLINITVLNMAYICNDEALRNIVEHCSYLVELNIAYSHVTNEGLRRYLCQKDEETQVPKLNLQKLNIEGMHINENQTALILKTFPELTELEAVQMPCILHNMHQSNIDQNNFSNVNKFKLTHLDTLFCPHLSTSPELLKLYALVCPDVRVLKTILTDADQVNTLAAFTKVKDVDLDQDDLYPLPTLDSFLHFRGFRLTVLKLNGFSIYVEELIKYCPVLEELHLTYSNFLYLNGEVLPNKLKFLKKFILRTANFKNSAVVRSICAILSSAHKLEDIRFYHCRFFTDEIKEIFTKCCICCPLKRIHFYESDFHFSLLQSVLLNSRTLKVLRIEFPVFSTPDRHTNQANVDHLSEIASSVMNKPIFEILGANDVVNTGNDLAGNDLDIFRQMFREINWM